jgi:hypothetical protein
MKRKKESRAALMATLSNVLTVLVQFALAAMLLRKATPPFERETVDTVADVMAARIGADNVSASRGDPRWLALIRVPPPLAGSLSFQREGISCS